MDLSTLLVNLGVDASALTQGIQSALAALSAFASQAGAAGRQAGQNIADGFRQGNAALEANFRQLDKLTSGYQRLGSAIQSAGNTLTRYLTLPILAGGVAAVATAAQFEKLQLGLQTLSKQDLALQGITGLEAGAKSAELAKERFAELQEVAKAPGIGLEQAVQGDIRLRSVGISADLAKRSLVEFANAIAKSGGDATQLDQLTVQLGQLGASAKLTAADLKPILNAAPSVAVQLQKLYGTVSASEIQKQLSAQGQSTKDFIGTLVTELAKSERAAGGLGNSFDNFGNAVQASLARVGDSISKNLNLQALVDKAAAAIERLADAFVSLSPATQKALLGLAGGVALIGPLLVAFGGIVAILPALEAGFATLGIASISALAPILPIVAGVAAAAVAIYENWDAIVAYFQGPNGNVFRDLGDAVVEAFDAIKEAITALLNGPVGQLWGELIKLQLAFDGKLLQTAVALVTIALTNLATQLRVVVDIFRGDFKQAAEDGNAGMGRMLKTMQDLLGIVPRTSKSLGEFLKTEGKQTTLFAPGGSADFGPAPDYFGDDPQKPAQTLDQLKEKLKGLREEFGKAATNSKEFFNLKKQIADLDAYIKKLEDTGKAARKAADDITKAFTDAQNKVVGIGYEVKVGDVTELEGATEKVKALRDAVKKVAEMPGGIGSQVLVKLTQQAADAGRALDKLLASPNLPPLLVKANVLPDTKAIDKLQAELDAGNLKAKVQFDIDGDVARYKQALASNNTQFLQGALANPNNVGDTRVQGGTVNAAQLQFDASNAKNLAEYTAALRDAATGQQLFGAEFDSTGAKLDATANRLRFLYAELAKKPQPGIALAMQEEVAKLKPIFEELQQQARMEQLGQSIQQALVGALEGLAESVGEELGKVLAGAESGTEAMGNLFKSVLRTIGGFLKQLGSALIAYGVAMDAFKKAFSNPYVAIAAGAALLVIGGIVSGLASAGPAGGGSSGYSGSGASVGASAGSSYQATKSNNLNINVSFQPVTLRADGAELRAVMQVDSYRLITRR